MPRTYPSRISKRGADAAPAKRPRAISYIANCPPERRPSITAEQVASFSGLNINAAGKLLAEMQARFAATLKNTLLRIEDPAVRKIVIMSKWQRGEITAAEAEYLIAELGLKEA